MRSRTGPVETALKWAPAEQRVVVELDLGKLESLICNGQLCVADISCRKLEHREHLKYLCLRNCAKSLHR